MKRIDFSECELSNIEYSGVDEKIGVLFCDAPYMLKFKNKNVFGEAYNDISEYIGAKVFELLGFETQFVCLGLYKGRKVAACKDFCYPNKILKPFGEIGESSIDDKGEFKYSFDDIKELIEKSTRFSKEYKQIALMKFWDIFIVDCLLANKDRHARNWGYFKEKEEYKVAPIYDNGNSLFSGLNDEQEIEDILNSEDELNEKVEQFPRSLITVDGVISNYFELITSKRYKECNDAVIRIVKKINLKEINKIIDSIDVDDLSESRKCFLKTIIKLRYEKILLKTYEDLTCQ